MSSWYVRTRHPEARGASARPASFAAFACLFALATISYHAQLRWPFGADLRSASFLSALVVLARPKAVLPLLSVVAIQTLAIYRELPDTNTNRLLQFFVGLTVLAALPAVLTKGRGTRLDGDALLSAVRTPLQIELLFVYVWAFVHKLNWGFLTPFTSCAVELAAYLPFVGAVPNVARAWLIATSLAVEGALAPLLVFPRTRTLGVRVALVFHFVLGIAWFYSFSITMFALLSLFVSRDQIDQATAALRDVRRRYGVGAAGPALVGAVGVAAMLLYVDPTLGRTWTIAAAWNPKLHAIESVNAVWSRVSERLFLGLWYLTAGPVVFWWLAATRGVGPATAAESIATGLANKTARPALAIAGLVFINGASPYLGWKSETSFAMYSNLRTEAGFQNHLFLPTIPLAGYQSEIVSIISSTDEELQALAEQGRPVPLVEVRRRISSRVAGGSTGTRVRYSLGGVERNVDVAESDPVLSAPLSYTERKFLRFRDIVTATCWH